MPYGTRSSLFSLGVEITLSDGFFYEKSWPRDCFAGDIVEMFLRLTVLLTLRGVSLRPIFTNEDFLGESILLWREDFSLSTWVACLATLIFGTLFLVADEINFCVSVWIKLFLEIDLAESQIVVFSYIGGSTTEGFLFLAGWVITEELILRGC